MLHTYKSVPVFNPFSSRLNSSHKYPSHFESVLPTCHKLSWGPYHSLDTLCGQFDIYKCSISLHVVARMKSLTIIPLRLALSSRIRMSHLHNPNANSYNICPNYGTGNNPKYTNTIATPETSNMEKWVRVRVLGEGSYGVVWLEKKGQEIRAVKQVSKANFILNQRELYALEELKKYPKHFVKLLEWFEDQKNIYIAMEYIEHGDLMGVVKSRQGSISEDEIRSVARQLLIALRIMHSKNFCHRDLKPQNILVTSISPIKVKIADFGVTKQSSDSTQLRTVVGTWGYMAPEVLGFSNAETSWYTSSADIWSLGSLLHFIFTNEVPFPDNRKLINYVWENNSPFPTEKLQERGASSDAKDFIKSLMSPCPEKRLTAKQALEASWLRRDEPGQISPLPQIILPNAPEPTRVSIQNDSGYWKTPNTYYPSKFPYPSEYNTQEEGLQSMVRLTEDPSAMGRHPHMDYTYITYQSHISKVTSSGLNQKSNCWHKISLRVVKR